MSLKFLKLNKPFRSGLLLASALHPVKYATGLKFMEKLSSQQMLMEIPNLTS
jgi:hypothetical protein